MNEFGTIIRGEPTSSAPAPGARPAPRALGPGHFRRIAVNGFGDGCNSYAWSCAWYEGAVYIGTIRHVLATMRSRLPVDLSGMQMPVPIPETIKGLDLCGQIWRYRLETGRWDRVYRSPWVEGLEGRQVPLAYGFRNMSIFQGKRDPRPMLYSIPSCGKFGVGPVLLRSEDGETFEVASKQGLGVGDPNIISFRGNLIFKGRLFVSPAGSRGGHCNTSFNAVLLCSDDPAGGEWQVSNPPGFGDPSNDGIFDIGVCGDYLYAGTINVRQGAQLWKTDGEGPPPHHWTKVFDQGADRGAHNQAIVCFAALRGVMYLGTAIQHGGYDRHNNIGPAAAEILRVYPDDSWDMVMGEPRLTRQGLKIPVSGYGPGFDNPFCGYIWRMTVHDDVIYIGTYDSSSLLPFADPSRWPAWTRRIIDPETLESFMSVRAGGELWRSTDGDRWVPVTRNGFGNRYNWGFRALLSTPRGLFVGTANPFGPQVARRGADGYRFEDNPRGGLEIWHGSLDHAAATGSDVGADGRDAFPWFDDASATYEVLASRVGTSDAAAGSAANPASPAGGDLLDDLIDLACREPDPDAGHADRSADPSSLHPNPFWKLAATPKDLVGLTEQLEDEVDAYFGGYRPGCVGFWMSRSETPRYACDRLIEELLSLIPAAEDDEPFPTVLVMGVDPVEAERLIRRGRPGAQVVSVEAEVTGPGRPGLRIADNSINILLWVEGLSRWGRRAALDEARRILKPGGRLLAAELVGTPADRASLDDRGEARGDASKRCELDLAASGLVDPRVLDVTNMSWTRFHHHSREYFSTKLLLNQIDRESYRQILDALPGGGLAVEAYLLFTAARPHQP